MASKSRKKPESSSRVKGNSSGAWNEFFASLPEDYKNYAMGDFGSYGESSNFFRDAFHKYHPMGIKERISGEYDLGNTPEEAADIFFFQNPNYGGNPEDETDNGNILYKAHPEMRAKFLSLVGGTPREHELASYGSKSALEMAKALSDKYKGKMSAADLSQILESWKDAFGGNLAQGGRDWFDEVRGSNFEDVLGDVAGDIYENALNNNYEGYGSREYPPEFLDDIYAYLGADADSWKRLNDEYDKSSDEEDDESLVNDKESGEMKKLKDTQSSQDRALEQDDKRVSDERMKNIISGCRDMI